MCVPTVIKTGLVGHMCDRLDCMCNGVFPSVSPLQISAHQKKGLCRANTKDLRTLGVYGRRSTYCRKRWEDLRRWARKTAEAQMGLASQRGRDAGRNLTPLMVSIPVVAYPELDGRLRASQQPQGGIGAEKGEPLALVGLAEAYFDKLAPEQRLIGDSDARRIGRNEGL
ncbi:hypothetical protein NDU88_001742 [Pleurodeles waltl]|uniref:Uncharacterized protein n=1 Tax=Pleurodeles waltl TaxID=8319 RepID=A0AAV7WJE1_PLEWA|nr:hypothetical protein NDU88_001742 [Pleurodeles waltl]